MEEIWKSDALAIGLVFIGFCVGSFLNVVIHRVPRGLSVNEPKRSFCPSCEQTLPAWQNIPVLTWLLQRGKCRSCGAPIAIRYLVVELLTGGLFFLAWWLLPMASALLALVLFIILVTVTFIDAEHQLIPIWWTSMGSLIAILGGLMTPQLLDLSGELFGPGEVSGWEGLRTALVGWLVGFGGLYLVVIFGKLVFGRIKLEDEQGMGWKLQEGHDGDPQLHFVIGDRAFSWDEIFYRGGDRLLISGQGIRIDGKRHSGKEVTISREEVRVGDERWRIEELRSLVGKADRVVIPREAMGMGDPHLLGMIGAFLGWPALLFVVLSSCLLAIVSGMVARVGFGKALPFGPFLSAGALAWILGGWQVWRWYFGLIQERGF